MQSPQNNNTIVVTVNDETIPIPNESSLADLLRQLNISVRAIAVECNGEIQPVDSFDRCILVAGDTLEIVTLVGGG